MKKRHILTIAFILALALALVIALPGGKSNVNNEQDNKETSSIDTSSWKVVESDQYDFSIKYPAMDWNSGLFADDEISPKFNFYIKPQGVPLDLPLDHFANVTHASVYPEGIPTEGVFGPTKKISSDWGKNVDEQASEIYVLEDGTPFAAYIKFKNTPESWGEAGFAWARLKIEDYESHCYKNGELIGDSSQCDPMGNPGVEITHSGKVDSSKWSKLKAVIKTLSFE